jgi:hypothetical protein
LPVRVAVVDLPPMLSDIVKDILNQPADVLIVGAEATDEADVIILAAQGDELPPAGRSQLERRPAAKVLTISSEGRRAYLYELLPHRTNLGEVSTSSLLKAVLESGTGGRG